MENPWYKYWWVIAIVVIIGLNVLNGILSSHNKTSSTSPLPQTNNILPNTTSQNNTSMDYEHDLTERCKDWIYYRNRAYKLGREGDQKGSEEARIAMLTFDGDLQKYFTEKQISDEINRLEASGYKGGF